MNKYEVIIDFGSKYFNVEAKNAEEAKGKVLQQIENDTDFNLNEEYWVGCVQEVEE